MNTIKKSIAFFIFLLGISFIVVAQRNNIPDWTRDLIIYEINPYAFTSPKGPGSGNFKGLNEKLSYIEELGVNSIWMVGFNECTEHFYGIKTPWAMVRPDKIDPSLGTPQDFKDLIKNAHDKGIRIFLDVTTHGVINESPLVKEHPDWFRGGSWKMQDFDYSNKEFLEWWIDVWVNYVVEYGIDGFRLDGPNGVASSNKVIDVWDAITSKCAELGHPILVFPENCRYHFSQTENRHFQGGRKDLYWIYGNNPTSISSYEISCHDLGWAKDAGNYYTIKGSRGQFIYYLYSFNIPIFMSGEEFDADQVSLPNLSKDVYENTGHGGWLMGSWVQWDQINEQRHRDMLEDVKKMIRIKNENRDIIHYHRPSANYISLSAVPCEGNPPYARYIPGKEAIAVFINPLIDGINKEFVYSADFMLEDMGLSGFGSYKLIDLWTGATENVKEDELKNYTVTIPPDFCKNGGFRIYKIIPNK